MRTSAALLLAVCLASGCGERKPAARLTYVQMTMQASGTLVEFDSDIDLEALYAKNSDQKIVVKNLMCALGDDQNFDVTHKMQAYFLGSVQLHGKSKGESTRYRYRSIGHFYRDTPGKTDMKLLAGADLLPVLGNKKTVPCKVIMTIYMSSPYYSQAMMVPVADILRKARPPQ